MIDPCDNFPILLPLEREQEGEAGLVPKPSQDKASGSASAIQTTHATEVSSTQSLVPAIISGDVPPADPSHTAPEITLTIDVEDDIYLNLKDISEQVLAKRESV